MTVDLGMDLDSGEEFINNVYSYVITDLRTNQIVSELPFTGASYEKNVSKTGSADLSLIINDETLEMNPNAFTIPGRVGVYIFRNQKVMWGGIIFKRQYDSSSRQLRLTCKSFEEYFYRIIQRYTLSWSSTEQLDIAREFISKNKAHSNVLIDMDMTTVTGMKRERNMYDFEFKTVGEELERLSSLLKGFDWNVDVYTEPTTNELKRTLNFYYPTKGKSKDDTDLLFEFPGSIREFTLSDDAEGGATKIYGIGAGEGESQLWAEKDSQASTPLVERFPPLEKTKSYKSVSVMSTLQSHIDSDMEKEESPVTVIEVTLRGDGEGEHEVGTYDVGDWARFRIDDPFLPEPIDEFHRITGYKVSVEDNSGLETVTLVLGDNDANLAPDSELG